MRGMTVDDGVRGVAGTFVLASLALGYWVHPGWFLFTAFVGANLLQSAFTGTCPMFWLLKKVGLPVSGEARASRGAVLGAELPAARRHP
jgi:hypothetical protein